MESNYVPVGRLSNNVAFIVNGFFRAQINVLAMFRDPIRKRGRKIATITTFGIYSLDWRNRARVPLSAKSFRKIRPVIAVALNDWILIAKRTTFNAAKKIWFRLSCSGFYIQILDPQSEFCRTNPDSKRGCGRIWPQFATCTLCKRISIWEPTFGWNSLLD